MPTPDDVTAFTIKRCRESEARERKERMDREDFIYLSSTFIKRPDEITWEQLLIEEQNVVQAMRLCNSNSIEYVHLIQKRDKLSERIEYLRCNDKGR